ncbi:MAG: pre-peptidase C-terminal domain-containing protein [Prevotella sp.]|nr:pre-peptidase C-terminal domain-containing protein [Prevotella sp.]
MKTRHLLTSLILLLSPLWALAQYWESGTVKTNNFFNYTSGGNTYSKTEVSYLINSEQDGKMEFYALPLGDVRITGISLYAVEGDELLYVANDYQTLTVEDVAAGLYQVKFFGQPTDKSGLGGNFQAGYVLTPADYVNDPEPNDTWERAYQIESGNVQHGHLGYKRAGNRDEYDWYRIVVPDEGTVTLATHTYGKLHLGWVGMYVPNAEGTDVVLRNDRWMDAGEKDTTLVYTVPDVAPGTYYVRMQRNNGYGSYKLTYTFTANSYGADAPGNDSWDKALDMALDTPTDGRLGYNYYRDTDGADWYRIVVTEEGKLTYVVKTETTLHLGWLGMYTPNAEGTDVNLRNDRWMDAGGKDTTLVYEVPDVSIGTYYVRMQRNNGYGGYRLTCYFTSHADEADPEPNDTWTEALDLKNGPAITGQLGYNYNNNTDGLDWYKIVVPKEGAVVFNVKTESTLRLGWLGMYVPNEDGTDVVLRNDRWMDAAGQDTTLVYNVPDCQPGTYYVRMQRNNGYGTYTLQYIHNPNAHDNDPEPNDEWSQGTLVESGTRQQGCLGYDYYRNTDGADWFKIELPDEGTVTLAVTTEQTLHLGWLGMYVPNEDGTDVVLRNDTWMDAGGKDTTLVYTVPGCKPGLYYVRMQRNGGYGGYDLDYTFTPNSHGQDNLDNDTWDKATIIANNTTQQGRLGYDYYRNTDVYDWFKIELPDEGTVTLAVTTEQTLHLGWLGMYVPNEDGSDVVLRNDTWMDAGGKDTTLVYNVTGCKPGLYYVRMQRNGGYGGYKLDYTFTPNVYGPDFADNDTWDKATVIEIGATQQGRLGYDYYRNTDAYDWYQIDVPYVGDVTLSLSNQSTLHVGWFGVYIPNVEGTNTNLRSDIWADAGGRDTTIVYDLKGLGAGTYYVRVHRNNGYGGYSLKYDYERNPYDRDNLQNHDFANRYKLTEGQVVSTTLGYSYRSQNNEDWYDLGLMHGRQIDVTISPDTTRTLIIGVPALYVYQGDREDGSPILQNVAESRIERSQGTVSYLDKSGEDRHYVFRVPNYNGSSYGGYTILFGSEQHEGEADLAAASVSVMTEGRNTVRKGVPCENPITVTNTSAQKTGRFLITVAATDNIDIIGFRMPGNNGQQYLPVDSLTVLDGGNCQHTIAFLVPSLDPWESYTFTMISEGKGDIAYSRQEQQLQSGANRIVVNSSTFAVVALMGQVAGADRHINVTDFIVHRVGDVYNLTGEQRLKLSQIIGQLDSEKQETGVAAYSVLSLLKRASQFTGISLLDATCPIATLLRQRIYWWIYQDDQYVIDDDDVIDILDGKAAITDVVASWDPNEMAGPQGVGPQHYLGPTQTVSYRILFENKAEAGDAAYRVRVSDDLDPEVFDVSTVRFGETSHDGVGYNWKMTREGNRLSWDIQGIELPPNVNAPEGEGFVSFSVDLKPGLADGTQIKNKATIIFDKNFPIETNDFVNTLDLAAPVTTMSETRYVTEASAMRVTCSASDAASGVQSYLLFVSENGGDYSYYGQSVTPVIDYPVEAENGHTYSFFVLATDNVGNTERLQPQSVEGQATGISTLQADPATATISVYTLDGRYVGRSLHSLPKGVYIIDGRKYVVK